ncbi:hypothetical protein SDRG_08296 [Saprolegnia diclina VS20]|uniref:Uncharacterized protein n=1 Tax=Saprolegnia diclina (strain VS20) TaxID=1156394 RepID=T0QK03_SAPDV|nr:hypothetical protein SDRG_08296 [Saprolegnia diclina VS20]EQC34085.1 hypothetical protein SDRG_08296 [Saprolegnia diclina VS20]|eukprot:XP_008612397.1 hypothetical protein SDRG_08296 [Saprolegnia diclina VS20]
MKPLFRPAKQSSPRQSLSARPQTAVLDVLTQPDLLALIAAYQAGTSRELARIFKKYRQQLHKPEYAMVNGGDASEFRCFVLFKLLSDGKTAGVHLLLREFPDGYSCPKMKAAADLYAIDAACRLGDLDVVKFLHEHHLGLCSQAAMDAAASSGSLSIVKYLHRHRDEGCTPLALAHAKRFGHIKIFNYLATHVATNETPIPEKSALTARDTVAATSDCTIQ